MLLWHWRLPGLQQRGSAIVLAEHVEGLADARQPKLEVCLGVFVCGVLFRPNLIHFCLLLDERRKFRLQFLHFLLELRGGRSSLVDLGRQAGNVALCSSQYAFSVASAAASAIRRSISSVMRPLTFLKGSSPNFAPYCIKTWI